METLPPHIQQIIKSKKLGNSPDKVRRHPTSGDVEELRNKYGFNLPPIVTLKRQFGRERNKHIINNIMKSQTTTPTMIKLLFMGQLPLQYYNDLYCGQAPPVQEESLYTAKFVENRERLLRSPKSKEVTTAKKIEIALYDARTRRRSSLGVISGKAGSHTKEVENVVMRHLDIESRGWRCYFDKIDKRDAKRQERRNSMKSAEHNQVTEKPKR